MSAPSDWQDLGTAIVLTNNADKKIMAIAVNWLLTDNAGHIRRITYHSDSFMAPGTDPIAMPHSRLLGSSSLFISEALIGTRYVSSGQRLMARNTALLQSASVVNVAIDSVIFEDGEVIGPNQLGYDLEIQGRKTAAEKLAKEVRTMIAEGKQPDSLLARISSSGPRKADYMGKWSVCFAYDLQRSKNLDASIRSLESMPQPPTFFPTGTR